MHQYAKFELDPYVNRYVWIETKLQAYVQSVDNQFVELIIMEDTDGWERNRPYNRPPNQPWQPCNRPPYNRPPYRPPYYQRSPFAPFLLPLAALTAIGLLF